MPESYDPRQTGPRINTPHGLRKMVTDLCDLIDRNNLHDRKWTEQVLPFADRTGEQLLALPTTNRANIEALYISMVRKTHLASTADFGAR